MEQYNQSPLSLIDTSFENYVRKRQYNADSHLHHGVPDYAFALDYELRNKLMQIPHLYTLAKKFSATYTANEIQMLNQRGIRVSPEHFGDIYQMGVDCAKTLGIGVPNMFIINDPTLNAYTLATDLSSPVVCLNSGLVERATPGGLKAVIAHECGHIHNEHLVLQYFLKYLLNVGTGAIGSIVLSVSNRMLVSFWDRAMEVSSDRAALLCCDDPQDVLEYRFRSLFGATLNRDTKMNIDALREQLEETLNNPTRILELGQMSVTSNGYGSVTVGTAFNTHPSSLRRIFAQMEFMECETLYQWRPDLKKPGMTIRTKAETDERCKKIINVFDNK